MACVKSPGQDIPPVFGAILLAILFFITEAHAQGTDIPFQFEPAVAANLEINKKVRFEMLAGREDSEDLSSERWKFRAGVSVRVRPLFRSPSDDPEADKHHFVVLKAFYEYSHGVQLGVTDNEHRIALEVTPRYWWPGKLLTSDRSRFEFRFINNKYSFRYRNRFRLERPVKAYHLKLTPYGSAEAYWDTRNDRWNQFKFTVGGDIPIGRRMSLDVYFGRRHCLSCESSQINDLGVTLNLFFKRKK